MFLNKSKAQSFVQEAPYTRVKLHLATSFGLKVVLPTNGNCLKRSGLLLQHSHATARAVPSAVLAAAPRFSAHLTLQQMDTRDALAYASSSA